jgi:ATPase subunit of ABC transporter with duplicated ATPase domains
LATQKNQAKKIETEKLIEKFRAKASKASMAQSIKKLDKIDRIEVDEDDNSVMNISFPLSKVPGKVVIEADVTRYGDKTILKTFHCWWNEEARLLLLVKTAKVNQLSLRLLSMNLNMKEI